MADTSTSKFDELFKCVEERLKYVIRSKLALYLLNNDRKTNYMFLYPKQFESAVVACATGDAICVLPTGYGKTLVYELLPYYHKVYVAWKRVLKWEITLLSF